MDELDFDAQVWRLHPVRQGSLHGAEQRTNNRALRRRKSEHKVLKIISQQNPDWLQPANQTIELAEVEALLQLLMPIALSADEYKFMHNFVCHSLARGNRLKRWTAKAPAVVSTHRREAPPRAVSDFQQLGQWRAAKQSFIAWLVNQLHLFSSKHAISSETKQHILNQSMVFSAMAFGGLCEPDALTALLPALAKRRVYQAGELVWIELYFASKRQSYTANSVDANTTLRRWFPDGLTLALINYSQQQQVNEFEQHSNSQNLIADLLKALKATELAKIPLPRLGKIAAQAYEIDNLNTPSFISAWNSGINQAHCLPHHVWRKLAGATAYDDDQPQHLEPINLEDDVEPSLLSRAFDFSQTGEDTDYLAQLKTLRECLQADKTTDKRVTQAQAIKNVVQLIEQQVEYFSPAMQLLVHWSHALLTTGSRYRAKLKPQSVYQYLGIIGESLVVMLQQENLLMYSSDEFELLYQQLAAMHARKPKQMASMLARLDEFHYFLVRQCEAEPLELTIKLKGRDFRPTVCANYINEQEYRQLKQLLQQNDELSLGDRNNLTNLFTLGYRTGLRIGELSKLTLNDVHRDQEWLLRIRENKIGTNKSESAYRLIPLQHLLTPDEFAAFTQHVAQRLTIPQEQTLLLFNQPGTINRKITAKAVSHFIVNPLRSICADNTLSFHSLRHSAINNCYIVLFIKQSDWPFDAKFYPPIPLKSVALVGNGNTKAGRELHAIAMLDGHCSPQETLLSYSHFLDLHQYLTLNPNAIPADVGLFSQLLQQSASAIQRDISRKNESLTAAQILKQRTIKQTALWANQINQSSDLLPAIDDIPQQSFKLERTTILAITLKYEQGKSSSSIATEFDLSLDNIESVIDAAKAIANIKTKKGKSRLIPTRRQRTIQVQYLDEEGQHQSQRTVLSPGIPTDKLIKEDANTILENLKQLMKDPATRADAIWLVKYVLHHVSPHKAGVPIYNMADAKRFVGVLKALVLPTRIYLIHNPVNPKLQPKSYDEQRFKYELLAQLGISAGAYSDAGNLRAGSEDSLGKLLVWAKAVRKVSKREKSERKPQVAYSLVYACHIAGIGLGARGLLS